MVDRGRCWWQSLVCEGWERVVSLRPSPWAQRGGLAEGSGLFGLLPASFPLLSLIPSSPALRSRCPVTVPATDWWGGLMAKPLIRTCCQQKQSLRGAHGRASKSSLGGRQEKSLRERLGLQAPRLCSAGARVGGSKSLKRKGGRLAPTACGPRRVVGRRPLRESSLEGSTDTHLLLFFN